MTDVWGRKETPKVTQLQNWGETVLKRIVGRRRKRWTWKSVVGFVPVLIGLWAWTLYWGERMVFRRSVDGCEWGSWERWPAEAYPHHLVFIADPQLVDPHTYPGRPWPLSTFTMYHTDQYIRRSWVRINRVLYPDTVFFLGDLFDGGREWSTYTGESEDATWHKYGEPFWLKEYRRFGKLFFDQWLMSGAAPRTGQRGRKLVPSLPGNHDLGFGEKVHIDVRKRFNAYFGDGNRVDVVGNHTFVSIDAVSLSAYGSTMDHSEEIWKPTEEFLDDAATLKRRAVIRELRQQQGKVPLAPYAHEVYDTNELAQRQLPTFEESVDGFPTILLTHVPLYRSVGEPCGPMREHWPPTPPPAGQTDPVFPDERNAISISGGYQYQNVLTEERSKDVTEKIGNISYAFSGDDHDYCEVVHRRYPSAGRGIREITVKSTSWAMGVRHPGFLMVSMWNPVDEQGNTQSDWSAGATLQTHLCLLPDQLGIFIRYATMFGITITSLLVRAILIASGRIESSVSESPSSSPLLPTINKPTSSAEAEKAAIRSARHSANSSADDTSSNGSSAENRNVLNARSTFARSRSGSPHGGYGLPIEKSTYSYPLIQHAGYRGNDKGKSFSVDTRSKGAKRKAGLSLAWAEFLFGISRVGSVAFAWYLWLIWSG